MRVFTVGHSNRSLDQLVDLLRLHRIGLVVDVRRSPWSRRHPWFDRDGIASALTGVGIDHLWLEGLGGRRSRRPRSPHTAWPEAGFAAYADHLESEEFRLAAESLLERAAGTTTTVLCAERRWELCHRRVISDWLTVRGITVEHLSDGERTEVHRLPPFARLEGDRLIYDGGQPRLDLR